MTNGPLGMAGGRRAIYVALVIAPTVYWLQTSALLPDAVPAYESWLREWTVIQDPQDSALWI